MNNKKYKITGRLVGGYRNPEGVVDDVQDIKYAKFIWTMRVKLFYMRLFYDYVELEVLECH